MKRKSQKNSGLKLRPNYAAAAAWINKYGQLGTIVLKGRQTGKSTLAAMIAQNYMDRYKYGDVFITTSKGRENGK